MTTFWIDADGRLILATSDPEASPDDAVSSTEIPPDSPRHQTWNGTVWIDDVDRAEQEQRRVDLQGLHTAGKNIALVLIELVDWQLANTTMSPADFTVNVRQAYLDLKAIANRVKI